MARRTVWLVTGLVTGAASSLYAERKLRRTVEAAAARLQPDALVTEMGRTARQAAASTGGRVRAAVATGRSEMQRRESEIWAGLDAAPSGASGAPPVRAAVPGPLPATPVDEPSGGEPPDAGTVTSDGTTHGFPTRGRGRRSRRSASHLGN